MAGVRGAKNPMPTKGDKATGIFSSRGVQKLDSTASQPGKSTMAYAKGCDHAVKPVKRDNMLKS